MSQFSQPAIANPEDKFTPSEHNGALLLFFPSQFKAQVATQHGESDAVTARIVNLENGRVLANAMIFSTALVTQLKDAVPDGMVLGRLGQGQNTKGNPPWLLSPHTEQDVARAEAWLAANPRNQFGQPQAQAGPPSPAAYAAPQGTPAWGQQAAPAPSAPQGTGGWGSPAPAPQQAWGQAPALPYDPWQNTQAAPAPQAASPAAGGVDPGLVAALAAKGVTLPAGTTQQAAEGIWAVVGAQ